MVPQPHNEDAFSFQIDGIFSRQCRGDLSGIIKRHPQDGRHGRGRGELPHKTAIVNHRAIEP